MAAAQRVYDEYHPLVVWDTKEDCDILILDLPDFKKSNLTVQITSTGMVRIQGERQEQGNKWLRFKKEYPMPTDSSIDKVSAKFESQKLCINFPKVITPQDGTKQLAEPALPQKDAGAAGSGDRKWEKTDDVSEKEEEPRGVSEVDECAKKMGKNKEANRGGRKVLEKYYKEGTGNLVELIRRPGMLVMLGIGFLLVMALCLYMRNE